MTKYRTSYGSSIVTLVSIQRMTQQRTSRKPEILVALDRTSLVPLHMQVYQAIRTGIREGRLRPARVVPSTRTLAGDLSVSRGVVVTAYEQLVAEGYLLSSPGAQTRVASVRFRRESAPVTSLPEPVEFDFRPGEPDVSSFPQQAWIRAARHAIRSLQDEHLSYGHAQGARELREALIDYLARVRGVQGAAHHMIICTGAAQALGIAARTLRTQGARRIAVESPGHPDIRRIVSDAGLLPVPVRVDDDGLDVSALDALDVQAVLVSPAHQNPLGAVLSPQRRQHLITWASRTGAHIIEDDYDAEYRYDRPAVGSLKGIAPARVIYIGSASKILAPGLRLGWLLLTEPLIETGITWKQRADNGSPVIEQLVFASLVASGELDRHLRKMRRLYQSRRQALLDALTAYCPLWKVLGAAAGLHLVTVPPRDVNVAEIIRRAAARSVRLYPLSHYTPEGPARHGLVLGYARFPERDIKEAVRRFAMP